MKLRWMAEAPRGSQKLTPFRRTDISELELESTGSRACERDLSEIESVGMPSLSERRDSPNSDPSKWYFRAYCRRSSNSLKHHSDKARVSGHEEKNHTTIPGCTCWAVESQFQFCSV